MDDAITWARNVADRHLRGDPTLPYGDWSTAMTVIAAHYRKNPHLTTPVKLRTNDAAPARRGEEIHLYLHDQGNSDLTETMTRSDGGITAMGDDPEGEVGPRRVMKLPGPASAYSIITDAEGQTWVVQASDVDDQMDAGRTNEGSGMRFFGDRQHYQGLQRRIDGKRAFEQRNKLKAMAAAQKKFWGLS
jgi:hypothetical protein